MKELYRITWFGLRKDGYKLGCYYDPEDPAAAFEVEVAVPGLAAHRVATITINGAEIGRRSNVQAAIAMRNGFSSTGAAATSGDASITASGLRMLGHPPCQRRGAVRVLDRLRSAPIIAVPSAPAEILGATPPPPS